MTMHILIVTGGYVDINFFKEYIKTLSYDKVFAVDKGLEYVAQLGLNPDLIMGDFDTVDSDILARYEAIDGSYSELSKVIRYPAKKDYTDTELALHYAKKQGASAVTMIGATGSRLDHVFANIGLLIYSAKNGMKSVIVDANNRIHLLSGDYGDSEYIVERKNQWGKYVSIIPVSEIIEDVTIEGVEYPLNSAKIEQGPCLTVSNEIIEKAAHIHIGKGTALVIESRD